MYCIVRMYIHIAIVTWVATAFVHKQRWYDDGDDLMTRIMVDYFILCALPSNVVIHT